MNVSMANYLAANLFIYLKHCIDPAHRFPPANYDNLWVMAKLSTIIAGEESRMCVYLSADWIQQAIQAIQAIQVILLACGINAGAELGTLPFRFRTA